jgi:hypothetical protein
MGKVMQRKLAARPRVGDLNETAARAVNAEPWQPPPGMVKRQCPRCRYFFATLPDTDGPHCADCRVTA